MEYEKLPQCRGPKLHRFEKYHLPVNFERLLQTTTYSYVLEVTIDEKPYRVQMFQFYDIAEDELGLDWSEFNNPEFPLQVDPFFAACRAFGRIIDENQNGILAVECFGFLHIPAERERELAIKFGIDDWNRPADEYEKEGSQRQPFRAIVTSLLTKSTVWNSITSKKLLQHIRALNSIGVFQLGVKERNIIDSQLVNFSIAQTVPFLLFKTRSPSETRSRKEEDLVRFDKLMEDLLVIGAPRAVRGRSQERIG